jgi:hypothetical protein
LKYWNPKISLFTLLRLQNLPRLCADLQANDTALFLQIDKLGGMVRLGNSPLQLRMTFMIESALTETNCTTNPEGSSFWTALL